MSRRVRLVVALLVVITAAGGGWLAGARIKSPAQVAAETEPPHASLITVPVERMVIANDVVTRGSVRFDTPESIGTPQLATPELAPVVTKAPEVGDELKEGAVLFELAGRPTFALQGDLPLFRTVRPGAEGEDIRQFQTALARLGYDPGKIDGVYGPDTEAAMRQLYEDAGYEPLPTDEQVQAQVEAASDIVDGAREVYHEAKDRRDAATAAQDNVTSAAAALKEAQAALVVAQERLAAAEAGVHPDTGLPPTPEEMTALSGDVDAATTGVSAAQAVLSVAVDEADMLGPPQSITAELKALTDAREDLTDALADVGSPVPEGEFLFFNAFPLRVDFVGFQRGDIASGEMMRVSGSRLAIDSSVSIEEGDLIAVGDRVQIELTRLGIELAGTVSFKADRAGTNNLGPDKIYIEILPDEVRADLNNTNVKITIPVATESTGGAVLAVPAAALSATGGGDTVVTVEAADGSTRLVAVRPGLATAAGMVEVTPVDGELNEGDRVVVGFQEASDPGDSFTDQTDS
ncbi:MAG TPA: peptidoglycan-binding protein [Actinobacteria bacterium]|nr:peptidoglycan-binding protein [Actinomycetota bacterium]